MFIKKSYLYGHWYELQKSKNPNYKGKWKAPLIDNPGKSLHILLFQPTARSVPLFDLCGPEYKLVI